MRAVPPGRSPDREPESQRTMQVKVMRNANQSAVKYTEVFIPANNEVSVAISHTGNYYLKVKAEYPERPPFVHGRSAQCYVGPGGYSVLTFTYTIDERSVSTEGKSISRSEFDKDQD